MAILLNPVIRTRVHPGDVLRRMLARAISVARRERLPKIRLMLFDRSETPGPSTSSLAALGFIRAMTKRIYHLPRPLRAVRPALLDQVEFRPLAELGEEGFLEVYRRAFAPETRIELISADDDFLEIKTFAVNTGAFDPNTWLAAFHRGRPIGITLPQRHDPANRVGSNFYLGVVESERGHGFGLALQYAAIERLTGMGIKEIIGSTNVDNLVMARIFDRLGYEPAEWQQIYYYRLQSQR
jgi:RimJ/RimL family protein N-acetyltransferase